MTFVTGARRNFLNPAWSGGEIASSCVLRGALVASGWLGSSYR
jgi:hypothetical protein